MKVLGLAFLSLLVRTTSLYCSLGRVVGRTSVSTSMIGGLSSEEAHADALHLAEDTFGISPGVLPSVSSKINYAQRSLHVKHDVWVVGGGTLGEKLLSILSNLGAKNVVAETRSNKRAESIKSLGCEHRLREQRLSTDESTAKTVIICIPPSSSTNYTEEVHEATRLWAGPDAGGNLIYTSSIAVYGESPGNTVTESFRVDTRSASSTKLLAAEEAVLSRGGNVMRLAGLYTESRGPHSYWLNKARVGAGTAEGIIQGSADGLLNMLHYKDAASAVVALAQSSGFSSRIFLACDNEPVTKKEICQSALASGLYPDYPMPQFSESGGPMGKRCDSSHTRAVLNWQPKHTSIRVFMRRLGGDTLPDVPTTAAQHSAESTVSDTTSKNAPVAKTSALWLPGTDDDF